MANVDCSSTGNHETGFCMRGVDHESGASRSLFYMMRRYFTILFFLFSISASLVADDARLDTKNCTFTKDGKTFPLYGKVVYVTDNPDITVQFVDEYADIYVVLTDSPYQSCCEWYICNSSESYPDLRVKVVNEYADLKVQIVSDYPHVSR